MYPRTHYEMTEADLQKILDACKAVPVMLIGGMTPPSQQENANRAWAELGERMGFDYMTVEPDRLRGSRFFTAVPSEPPEVRKEREQREAAVARKQRIEALTKERDAAQQRLNDALGIVP